MYNSKTTSKEVSNQNEARYEETFKKNKLSATPGDKIL